MRCGAQANVAIMTLEPFSGFIFTPPEFVYPLIGYIRVSWRYAPPKDQFRETNETFCYTMDRTMVATIPPVATALWREHNTTIKASLPQEDS